MKMKQVLCLLLAVLTLLPLLCACAVRKPTDGGETTASSTTGGTVGETELPLPPKTDYKEWEFTIAAPQPNDWGVMSYDREEMTNDTINDAIYTRNRQLEKYFNITIKTETLGWTGTQADEFKSFQLANEDKIDMIAVGFYQSGKPLIVQDMILPWNGVKHIDLTQDWWNESVSKTLSIHGNYYLLVGDVNWYTMKETAVCYFNKVVANRYEAKVGDLYQMVRDKQWTFDKALTIAQSISTDNGDGTWDEKDIYGAVQNAVIGTTGFLYAANYRTVIPGKDGPQMNFLTEKMQNIVNYIYSFCFENNASYTEAVGFIEESKGIEIFFADRALLMFFSMRHAEAFRQYDSDFGIIPYPLYDEKQKEYSTFCDQWGLSCGLPCTATDTDRTGAILEYMSRLSRDLIVPAYYDKTLMGKIKRDDESEEMLNIIFSNILYDIGICYCTDLDLVICESMVRNQSHDLMSWYRTRQNKLERNYKDLFDHVAEKKAQG